MLIARTMRSYSDIVVKFYAPRAIKLDLSQSLADDIVWLAFRVLYSSDCSRFIEITLVINVELSEGILEAKDLLLLELRILSIRRSALRRLRWSYTDGRKAASTYLVSLITFMVSA